MDHEPWRPLKAAEYMVNPQVVPVMPARRFSAADYCFAHAYILAASRRPGLSGRSVLPSS
jgi:hypothetical protein